jgi:hypothetical protein
MSYLEPLPAFIKTLEDELNTKQQNKNLNIPPEPRERFKLKSNFLIDSLQ